MNFSSSPCLVAASHRTILFLFYPQLLAFLAVMVAVAIARPPLKSDLDADANSALLHTNLYEVTNEIGKPESGRRVVLTLTKRSTQEVVEW
jgi:hypothetical protein